MVHFNLLKFAGVVTLLFIATTARGDEDCASWKPSGLIAEVGKVQLWASQDVIPFNYMRVSVSPSARFLDGQQVNVYASDWSSIETIKCLDGAEKIVGINTGKIREGSQKVGDFLRAMETDLKRSHNAIKQLSSGSDLYVYGFSMHVYGPNVSIHVAASGKCTKKVTPDEEDVCGVVLVQSHQVLSKFQLR